MLTPFVRTTKVGAAMRRGLAAESHAGWRPPWEHEARARRVVGQTILCVKHTKIVTTNNQSIKHET